MERPAYREPHRAPPQGVNWAAFTLGSSLLFLGFCLAVAYGWWGLLVALPLSAFALALIDRSRDG